MSRAQKNHKYIFVVGGVMSGVGKGISVASIGKILSSRGFTVNVMKIDPYLNVDAGTMNPTEHGETFVLDSGLETDQDMGNYERFLDINVGNDDYMTSGMVYQSVIQRERALGYSGKCVEAIPHVRDEIINRIKRASVLARSNITIVEIGGTIGDFQNALFIEAARVMHLENPDSVLFIMVSYLPVPSTLGEMKTKPTQNAVRALNSYGVQPDIIIARSNQPLDKRRKEKLAIWCNVQAERIISAPDVTSIYDVPLNFERDKLSDIILKLLKKRPKHTAELSRWKSFATHAHNGGKPVRIGIVGKYFDTGDFVLSDAYLSVIEAIKFSSYELGVKPDIQWINAKHLEDGTVPIKSLSGYDGIIVPGGFGETGIEGKILAAQYCRENKVPYLGLCYGLHMLVIEYARNVAKLTGAHTTEINKNTKHPVIDILPEQKFKLAQKDYGGSMRLGAFDCDLLADSLVRDVYDKSIISERHRHRYEVNPQYVEQLERAGLVFSGTMHKGHLKEIAEIPRSKHPFMVGTQFHPELKARPMSPHPLFTAFIKAALVNAK